MVENVRTRQDTFFRPSGHHVDPSGHFENRLCAQAEGGFFFWIRQDSNPCCRIFFLVCSPCRPFRPFCCRDIPRHFGSTTFWFHAILEVPGHFGSTPFWFQAILVHGHFGTKPFWNHPDYPYSSILSCLYINCLNALNGLLYINCLNVLNGFACYILLVNIDLHIYVGIKTHSEPPSRAATSFPSV